MTKQYLYILVAYFVFVGCKKEPQKTQTQKIVNSSRIKYAKGFDIINEKGKTYLVLKRVFQNSTKEFKYLLSDSNDVLTKRIKVPVEKIVVTSTTHIPMLELLGVENSIVGFPSTKYISSKNTRALIDRGAITDLGSEQHMNTEKLLDLQPDLVVGFSVSSNTKLYDNIKTSGIPVIFNGDWLEETPLGRAEWIKFFGVLFGKEQVADSIFKTIEKSYNTAKEIAKATPHSPKVFSGSMFKDTWYVPAGESFTATFFADANLDYLWKNTKGTGSLQLNFESIIDKVEAAEYWLVCGVYETREQILNANELYHNFSVLHKENVYTIASKKGATGGIEYFEFAPIQPDLVLKDIIKITQPEVLKDYQLRFFKLVE